ncbi:AbrB/MazE/SpoVT family DNA-binding domain-containing protein [bacterium]|nr:MAG: AbrB/MazE/SpoVT family DNA-binding domain-containing protein [bacterium]
MDSCKSIVRLKSKSQLTIPAPICKKLGIKVGDLFKVEAEGNKIKFIPQVVTNKF